MKAGIFLLMFWLVCVATACQGATAAPTSLPPTQPPPSMTPTQPLPTPTEPTPLPPTQAPPTVTPTEPPATPTPAASGIPAFPKYGSADVAGSEVEAGLYMTPTWFSIPFTFETSHVYRGIGERLPNGELFGLTIDSIDKQIVFWAIDPAISVEEALSQLRATPNADVGPSEAVEVAGFSGTQFDLEGTTRIPAFGPFVGHAGGDWTLLPEHRARYILLDVNGRTMVIGIEVPTDEFDALVADFEQVLSTIEFLPESG